MLSRLGSVTATTNHGIEELKPCNLGEVCGSASSLRDRQLARVWQRARVEVFHGRTVSGELIAIAGWAQCRTVAYCFHAINIRMRNTS